MMGSACPITDLRNITLLIEIQLSVKLQMMASKSKQNRTVEDQNNCYLYEDDFSDDDKNDSLIDKFKMNQVQLRNKFKHYIQTHKKHHMPMTNQGIIKQLIHENQDASLNIREIRSEKKRMIEEMQHSITENQYFENKRKEQEKTFVILKKKYQKIEEVRKHRKEEVIQLDKERESLKQEIKNQKLKFKKSIDDFKYNLTKSRIECEQKKQQMADHIRLLKQQNREYIIYEKEEDIENKRQMYESVKEKEKYVFQKVSRVKEQKKSQAEELKLERLIRQLTEKEEIKIASSRIKDKVSNTLHKVKLNSSFYESKIREFRKSLGERRLEKGDQSRMRYPTATKKNSVTQSVEYSTNAGFPNRQGHYRSYTQEASYD